MNTNSFIFIGLDLGDGESSIAYVSADDTGQPNIFIDPSNECSIITAIAEKDGIPLIGKEALLSDGVTELAVCFKEAPNNSRLGRNLGNKLLRFAEEFYLLFAKTNFGEESSSVKDRVRVYIGHPTGWDENAKGVYDELFRRSPYIPHSEVVPESKAAFIHVRDYHGIADPLSVSVLVVDIGSSTTDMTFVNRGDVKNLKFEKDLGSRMIDQAIMEQVIENYNDQAGLRIRLAQRESDRAFLLYLCRKAKESWFSSETFKPEPENISFKVIIDECWPLLEKLDMEKTLCRPLANFSKGWKAGFQELLEEAKKQIKTDSPDLVLLTGGGSRMPFTTEVCREVFPDSDINPDKDPSLSVARGLAGFGRWRYRVGIFREEVQKFINSNELAREIHAYSDSLGTAYFKMLMQNAIDAVWRPMIHELRDGTLSSDEIGNTMDYLYKRFEKWFETPEGLERKREALDPFSTKIQPFLLNKTSTICKHFILPAESLKFELILPVRRFLEDKRLRLSLFDRVFGRFQAFGILAADKIIPIRARKWVPRRLVDASMDIERQLKKVGSATLGRFVKATPEQVKIFAEEILDQIERQLMEKIKEVEKLLR